MIAPGGERGGVRAAAGWLVFPALATGLATTYSNTLNFSGEDPIAWDAAGWAVQLGPLIGFGFLAGATVDLPDPEGLRGVRGVLRRRAVWLAVGPWLGFLVWAGILFGMEWADRFLESRGRGRFFSGLSLPEWAQAALMYGLIFPTLCYGWVAFTAPVLLRARRLGRVRRALARGLAAAVAFVGSLVGGFWAATEVWRPYFFDPRIPKVVLLAASGLTLACLAGCGAQTVGELRRRELFSAMLMAWVLGLALAWRWWSRPRGRG
jgi:hypothetical protein